ncbi:hypothetical protein OU997_09890 [Pseudomonas sp. SL4(2022)]|uniref:hypothetical protein n=1 Tax=Pseudomonas sp. SL4(2022) TaxID=2994661 RepID=UPI002270380E|nr:hypothetical protein [Pseudomonas sp. SL4(2022)]WAC46442.1 hypothetical protein OU997_09890 [Pseudomonas sp. SL4(2022)]
MQLLKIISTGLLWILSAAASAAEINVIGTYHPSAADPNSTQFKITVANNECIAVHCKEPDKNFIVGLQNPTAVMPRAQPLNKDSPNEEGGTLKPAPALERSHLKMSVATRSGPLLK